MILCRVIGNSVSTVQHKVYNGMKVLVVRTVKMDGKKPNGDVFLACDSVQAGEGDLVLCAREGNTARQILGGDDGPLHSVVMGIVDDLHLADES